ncbi:MAG: PQQ-like beta-propeller repeat protein [Candidatus Atribacteria bacterium]|nr:PQQ-like beta-propeller repeat protein [Candidatus Atribacteria bacterium]
MKVKITLLIILFCFLDLFISNVFAEVTIRGKVQYWNLEQGINATKDTKPEDIEGGSYLPARRLLIEVEFDSPITIDEQTYTDDSGNYEVTHRNPLVGDWEVDIEVRAEVKLATINDENVFATCYEGALDIWPYNGQTGDRSVGDDDTITFDVYIGGPLNNIEEWDGDEDGEGSNHLIAFFTCQVILDAFNWLKERLPDLEVIERDTSLFYPIDTDVTHYNQTLSPPGVAWIDVKKGFYYPDEIDKDIIQNNSKTISQRWQILRSTITHEYGHKIMHDVYWTLPKHLKFWESSSHQITTCKSPEFGWKEGWAEFFAAAILNWPTINGEKSDLSSLPLSMKEAYNIKYTYYPEYEEIFPIGSPQAEVPLIDFEDMGNFNWRDEISDDKHDMNEGENAAVLWDIFDPKGWEYLPKDQQEDMPVEWPVPLKWYEHLEDSNFEHIWEMIAGTREYTALGVTLATGVRQPDCLIDESDFFEDSFWYYWKNKDDGYGDNSELMHGLKAIMYNRGITSTEYVEHKPEVTIKEVDIDNQKIELEITEEDTEDQPYLYYNLVYPDDTGEYDPLFTEDQPLSGEWNNNTLSFAIDVLPFHQWPQNKLIVKVHDNMLCSFTDYIYIPPPLELKVGWGELPSFIPLNTRNHSNNDFYPGRKANINFWVENESKKNFRSSSSEYQNVPLKLSFFIDNNGDHHFDDDEKVWEEEIDDLPAISDKSFSIELLLSLDRKEGDETDNTIIFSRGFHDCKLMVSVLEEEENQDNNSVIDTLEFISSPELAVPDFAVENATFTIDWYKNIGVHFNLTEKCVDTEIIDKWNFYHENNPYILQWGPISYELSLRDEQGNNDLLDSGEISEISYHETKPIQLENINLNYISAGRYSLYLEINPNMLLPESYMENNHAFLDWFSLADGTTSPWFTKGGDRGHTGWKNFDLKPPLITDWIIKTDGIPVDMVCNSTYFYVLTSSGSIEKYNTFGELQYTASGLDGTPLLSSVMLLVYPDTENEKLFVFSDDYRLVLIDTQTGNKIWTSNHQFTETTYGSKPNIREYSRTLNFDGRYLIAGWPLALYRFDSNMNAPGLLWEKDKKRYGESFITGNQILAGQYLYNIQGDELERFNWMSNQAILYLQNIFTDRHKYNYLTGQLNEWENFKDPASLFSNDILGGNKMLCVDIQGNELWTLPDKIEQEYYPPNSTPQSIPVRIRSNSVINLWNGSEGYAYCINDKSQLLAVDLETGTSVWYREFVCPPEIASQFASGSLFFQSPLHMGEGFAVNIQKIIPFQNYLLVGTMDNIIYRLSSSQLDHLQVQGYIPSVFYGPSRLKVNVQAFNEQGVEIPLEDKITVTGDYINPNHPRYYNIQEEISLHINLPDSEMYLVDYPNSPYIVNNHFNFVDVQTLSPHISVPLVIDNIQSRRRISQKDAPAGEEFVLSMDDESNVVYKPRNDKNLITLYYSEYGQEDISQVLNEHSYNIIASIRDAQLLPKEYDFIDLYIHLSEGMNAANFSVKVNKKLEDSWSLDLANNILIIHCLDLFLEQNTNNLAITILKSLE